MKVKVKDHPNMYYLVHDFAGLFPNAITTTDLVFSGKVDAASNQCSCTLLSGDSMFIMSCSITESDYMFCNVECEELARMFIHYLYCNLIEKTSWEEFEASEKINTYFVSGGNVYRISCNYAYMLDMDTNLMYKDKVVFWDGYRYILDSLVLLSGRVPNVDVDDSCNVCPSTIKTPIPFTRSECPCMYALLFKFPDYLGNSCRVGDFVYRGMLDFPNRKYLCILQCGSNVTVMCGDENTVDYAAKCSKLCEEDAADFINRLFESVAEEVTEFDVRNDGNKFVRCEYDGRYYRIPKRYDFLLNISSDKVLYKRADCFDISMPSPFFIFTDEQD